MNIEELRELALSYRGATEEIKWEVNLCFMVCEKIFLVVGVNGTPTPCSFKVDKEDFEEIASQDGFGQAPYLAKGQWVRCADIEDLDFNTMKEYLTNSYELIKSKLTKKQQATLS